MLFASDNVTPANPEIIEAVAAANVGNVMPYGDDPISQRVREGLAALFDRAVDVHFATTGTAANALGLASIVPSYGAVFCTSLAHVNTDECAAPEFFTGGAKLIDVPTADGRLCPKQLTAAIEKSVPGFVHRPEAWAVSVSQPSECGSVYSRDQLDEIVDIARHYGLLLHMDGARFANAVAATGMSAQDMVKGIDVLSFGGSKNGCMMAEALVFFDPKRSKHTPFLHKRAGMLCSKMRFVSAQLEAYLADDLWMRNAHHANAMAQRLAEGMARLDGVRLAAPVETNMVFLVLPEAMASGLKAAGAEFYWIGDFPTPAYRFVTAWNTNEQMVDEFVKLAGSLA